MRRIRTEMFAPIHKGNYLRTREGNYLLFRQKKDAQALGVDVVKVTVTITPKEKI